MMKNYKDIKNLGDLQLELNRLKTDIKVKEFKLKKDSKDYISQYSIYNLIKKFATPRAFLKLDDKTHISSKIMSLILPMILNSTVFRGSGLVTKMLGAFVSRKIGKSIDADHLVGIFNGVKSLFSGKKKEKVRYIDYGIPPDSETY